MRIPEPENFEGHSYAPVSQERELLKSTLSELESSSIQIPSIINGKRFFQGPQSSQTNPWNHAGPPVATYHEVDQETIASKAIPGALAARQKWANTPFHHRAAIYKRAAKLVETKYRWQLMAATMLGQGKTCGQAEGDCVAEVIDTLNFHVYFCDQMYQQQPQKQSDAAYNKLDYRPLEGFVLAISPFNFTALGAHIAFTPALLGNVVLWKPSPMAALANYILYLVMEEAELPPGMVQFLPVSDPATVVEPALASRDFSGLHYTGSSAVLRSLWARIGTNSHVYKTFPRIVGESGGKNFHLVHNSCAEDVDWIASAAVRSAFEFQGQKCSAMSLLFVPQSMWTRGYLKKAILREPAKFTHGDNVKQLHHPLGPIVSKAALERFRSAVASAQQEGHALLFGGKIDDAKGFFVQPAIFEIKHSQENLQSDLITKELFGPLFSIQTYDDSFPEGFENVCKQIDTLSEYGLAGSIFARDREAVQTADLLLRDSVGMFCINDKCTGAVIGAHTFGGARSSGTNDKANSANVLLRFSSIRCVKDSATVGTHASQERLQDELNSNTSTPKVEILPSQQNVQAIQTADVVILAIKPIKREAVFSAPGLRESMRGKLIISIMAGITTAEIKRLAGSQDDGSSPLQVVRVMPNMAATIREAVSLCTADFSTLTERNLHIATWIFEQVGRVQFVAESTFDISAVLVGCAGSLLLLAIDGLLDAAVAEGIKRPEAQEFVVDSAIGMLKLVPAGNHPSALRERIASPGGCSIRAFFELEKRGVRSAFTDAIMVAAERSRGMSKS
ncbi:hypothetical protein M409DRAFT_68407 [Zasmidium cellare ATCC 36951]|uniref:L-glutamate gamma-semialdehyde dehydrogenase n=1 Tax=Zasmidium cellare ATCC 36951 TaxID=1080233 RepID=A0A6A6C8U1_ZASCE|nr:uncharacterized protein M409DRAFT_68407 [Zasmidium cellare ATCC 36951]KAF2163461.1 hypothetical protein M409DRAFT_68407 [Zasmidium cellare ATCC 36951]